MRNVIFIVAWLSMVAFCGLCDAHEQPSKAKKSDRVYCCHLTGPEKGQCDKLHTKEECEKDGCKVVKDCKERR